MRLEAALFRAFESDPSAAADFLDWLAERRGSSRPARLLDLGCGTGRLFQALHERGWMVTGMEPNPSFREAARAVGGPLGIEVREGGYNDLEEREAYDFIIGVQSSFAHLLSAADRADALVRCRRALAPDGLLLLDVPNYLWILFHYQPPEEMWADWAGRRVRLVRRHRIDHHAAIFTTLDRFEVLDSSGEPTLQHEMVHAYAMITYPELASQLAWAGFSRPWTFCSYRAREPEKLSADRMILVSRRQAPEREP